MSTQQLLFDVEPVPWEADAASSGLVCTVVIPNGPDGQFDYLVRPVHQSAADGQGIQVGCRVRVPLGKSNRGVIGYCVDLQHRSDIERSLKFIEQVLDAKPLVSASMLRLTRCIADYYLCGWAQILNAVLPRPVRTRHALRQIATLAVAPDARQRIGELSLPEKQSVVMQVLAASKAPLTQAKLAKLAGCTTAPIQSLRKKGLITVVQQTVDAAPDNGHSDAAPAMPPQLTQQQERALGAILTALRDSCHKIFLLHGVTGSGKTEVYLRAIAETISYGQQAIMLVPEISLTPQTVQRFRSRFVRVAVLHSHQSDAQRHAQWRQIAAGEVEVVVGARSAVFAPTPHLGLIVLDEEHETSFKQDVSPRYHAREVACRRAEDANVPLVLGSATPSLESWQRALAGAYQLLTMPHRIQNRPMPKVQLIDLRVADSARQGGAITQPLFQAMQQTLRSGQQVVLLLNRRGFSTHVQCPACGKTLCCPQCDLSLTFHRQQQTMRCHHCDHHQPPPSQCPSCTFKGIRYGGTGTQKLEDELRRRFGEWPVVRMDTDTTRAPGSHAEQLDRFRSGEAKILLGTQMIAKGLDFPNVTLVGVINADTALHLPDFRAAERTFQLVTQVAGRTGRGELGGRVIVQTFSPEHPVIAAAASHDFHAFAAMEMPNRHALQYPPYAALVRLVIRGEQEESVKDFSKQLATTLRSRAEAAAQQLRILGPAPAPIAKLKSRFRYQIHAHAADRKSLCDLVCTVKNDLRVPKDVQWTIDVDPIDML